MEKNNLKYKEYSVLDTTEISPDTVTLKIKGKIKFQSGQFVQVMLKHYGEVTLAVCSDRKNKEYFELCVRGCGNTTNQMIKMLPGDKLYIRGPYGNFWPERKMLGKNIIIIAGGMGMVPLRPLLFDVLRKRVFYKNLHFIGGFKNNDHIIFEKDLLEWQEKFDSFDIYAEHIDKKSWGKKGLITDPIKKSTFDPNSIVLLCGPEIMFNYCAKELIKKGISEKNIYVSFERRMECGIGICQHCNVGKFLVCRDGTIFRWDIIKEELGK